ncbi:MAG TPA: ankyrin repeat domain-containing protein, partial [Stellaceae bacterium]|nr:ankyrin repeat domain-containing protein [Stellaceae bacterium]
CTPLSIASRYGVIENMKLLLDSGADINSGCDNPRWGTALYAAILMCQNAAVGFLLERGADSV